MFSPRRHGLAIAALALPLVACGQPRTERSYPVASSELVPSDAGAEATAEPAPAAELGGGPNLYALAMMTPIVREIGDKAPMGYLRMGAKVRGALAEVPPDASCREGYYELRDGGYVCARYATFDGSHPRLAEAPPPPALEDPLPYTYGYNTGNGTPIYRWIPSRDARLGYEPWLVKRDVNEASEVEGESPWYLRDWDGGKPQVTLGELEGDGPIARRMVRGFYVSVDTSAQVSMYETIDRQFVPKDRVYLAHPPTDFHGVWLGVESPPWPRAIAQADGGAPPYWIANPPQKLPFAFVNGIGSKRWTVDGFEAHPGEAIVRFTPVGLGERTVTLGNVTYLQTTEGDWLRESDVVALRERALPSDLTAGEKWIDVDLKTQSLVAYVGDKPVFATMISSGRYKHETPRGTFHIREKHVSSTMAGDGSGAGEGPYAIEDVPWIMYFHEGYALHAAFWHSNFGHRMSHGCVNLSPSDARALFGWTGPRLPEGWHGVSAKEGELGTRIVIHD